MVCLENYLKIEIKLAVKPKDPIWCMPVMIVECFVQNFSYTTSLLHMYFVQTFKQNFTPVL